MEGITGTSNLEPVRSTGNNVDFELAAEVCVCGGVSLVGRSPYPVGSDASSRELVSELSKTAGGPAGIAELLGVWKPKRLQGK